MIFAKEMSYAELLLIFIQWFENVFHANLIAFVGYICIHLMYLTQEIIMIVQNVKNKLLLSW